MNQANPQPALGREQVAKLEIGRTDIRPNVAKGLVAAFLASIFAVPLAQHLYEVRGGLARGRGGPAGAATSHLPRCYDIFASLPRAWRALRTSPTDAGLLGRVLRANNRVLLRDINEYADSLKNDSLLSDVLLPPTQRFMAASLGVGNEQAYVGRDGWLFYRPGVDYVTGPGFLSARHSRRRENAQTEWKDREALDPVGAILDFASQLDRRGIRLVLLPTPIKAMIHPEKLSRRYADRRQVLQNPSFGELIDRLSEQAHLSGIAPIVVYDPAPDLLAHKHATDDASELYLRTDTHWRPETMDLVSQNLAAKLSAMAPKRPPAASGGDSRQITLYRESPQQVTNIGDIAAMLQPLPQTDFARRLHAALAAALPASAGRLLSDRRDLLPTETVTIGRVTTSDGQPWRADPNSDVLLLGDSFANIYSSQAMGWGEAAGLAERLSLHLGRPVDTVIRNDGGSHATRKALADCLRTGRDRLAGKRVIVWQFAVRELAVGDWQRYNLSSTPPRRPAAEAPSAGRRQTITGRIAALKRPPRPGTVAYKNHIMALHLVDVRDEAGAVRAAEAVVFLWGMRDNKWTPAARYQAGQTVRLVVQPWSDVAGKLGTIRRSEPDEVGFDAETFWSEESR